MNLSDAKMFYDRFEEVRQRALDLHTGLTHEDHERSFDRDLFRIICSLDVILSECESIQSYLDK